MLNLRDNKFKAFQAIEFFTALPATIEKLDLSGRYNAEVNLKNLSKSVVLFTKFLFSATETLNFFLCRLKALRSLSVGKLSTPQLQAENFLDFGLELEDLKLAHASIDSIKSHAFKNVRGVRRLDLSENRISQIDNDAFAEVCKKKFKLIMLSC